MSDNLRHAQYREDGTQIDDPQKTTDTPGGGGGGGATNLTIGRDATSVTILSDAGTDAIIPTATGALAGILSAAEQAKLAGIAALATANSSDASLRDRATHTGTQLASTISDFATASDARITAAALNALSDVVITAPTATQVLKFNGVSWVNDADATGGGGGATNLSFTRDATSVTVASDTGTDAALPVATGALAGVFSAVDKTKLDTLAASQTISSTVFVHSAGNDATAVVGDPNKPFSTVAGAIAGAAGALKFRFAGAFNCGAGPVIFPAGADVLAYGATFSFDGSLNVGTSKRACIETAAGSGITRIRGLNVEVALSGLITCAPIGWNPVAALAFPDFVLEDCYVNAKTDILYMGGNSTGRLIARNCTFVSNWDIVYGNASTEGSIIIVENCTMIWQPRKDALNLTGNTWGQMINSSRLVINGGSITYDEAGGNTGNTAATWSGLNISNTGQFLPKLIIGGGFVRYNKSLADEVLPFIVGDASGSSAFSGIILNGPCHADVSNYTVNASSKNVANLIIPVGYVHRASFPIFGGTTLTNRYYNWKLSAAALTQTFGLLTLPPGCVVTKVWLERRTAIAGVVTCTAEVGITGNTTKYVTATDVKVTGATAIVVPNAIESIGDPNTTAGTLVVCTVRSTVANLSAVTSGAFVVHVEISGISSDFGVAP